MRTYEEEFEAIRKSVDRITRLLLFPKKIDLRGAENFVREGPNIIVGNHIGAAKDVSVLLRTVPRMIFFTGNRMFFNRQEASELVLRHLHRHMGKFGGFVHLLLIPFYSYMVDFVSGHIARIGTIPVDLYGSKRDSIVRCQGYLMKGRAVIALQGRGRVHPRDPNPYVKEFRRGRLHHGLQPLQRGRAGRPRDAPVHLRHAHHVAGAGDDQGERRPAA